MSKMQRDKGARVERSIVDLHLAAGIKAERVPLSGASHYKGRNNDIDVYGRGADLSPFCGEVKARRGGAGFATISRWLANNDFLVLKADRQEPLVVLPWRVWVEVAKR